MKYHKVMSGNSALPLKE